MQIITLLINTLKSKIMPVWTKISKWFHPGFLMNRATKFVRETLLKALEVSPRDAEDYYSIGRWQVSRRLACALLLAAGILSIFYINMMKPENLFGSKEPYRTYRYNSIPLRFYKGKVKILGKSGYTAYIGEVEKGKAQGKGTLYDKTGDIVYEGDFLDNQYTGSGKLNYPGNLLQYEGEFQDNQFGGSGILYRENGTKKYKGEFSQGKSQGEGIRFGDTGEPVYTGNFQGGDIVFEDLVGKSTSEAAEMYTGKKKVYSFGNQACVAMPEIQAVYCGQSKEDALEEEWKISGVYVLKDSFRAGEKQLSTISELTDYFGSVSYEGNTSAAFGDAVAVNQLSDIGETFGAYAEMSGTNTFSDVEKVEAYDDAYQLYVTVYTGEQCQYLFFSDRKRPEFFFYLIEETPE